ncbi:MAG: hypothetical protein HOE90_10495 [Bacteriovoracaceae bacterium]|nr:hypothetical protein [Bacteriovoracaceae bacterium]
MKGILFFALLTFSAAAFSCPTIEGQWKSDTGVGGVLEVTSVVKSGVKSFLFATLVKGKVTVKRVVNADGKVKKDHWGSAWSVCTHDSLDLHVVKEGKMIKMTKVTSYFINKKAKLERRNKMAIFAEGKKMTEQVHSTTFSKFIKK